MQSCDLKMNKLVVVYFPSRHYTPGQKLKHKLAVSLRSVHTHPSYGHALFSYIYPHHHSYLTEKIATTKRPYTWHAPVPIQSLGSYQSSLRLATQIPTRKITRVKRRYIACPFPETYVRWLFSSLPGPIARFVTRQ